MTTITIDPAVVAMVKPGAKLRYWFGIKTPTPRPEIWHIVAIIETGLVDGDQVIYRTWSRTRRSWRYSIVDIYALHLAYIDGALEKAR